MKPPGPHQIERAMALAMRLRAELADDQEGFALSLASETDVMEMLDAIVEQSVSAGDRADRATERAKRLNARKDRLRDTAGRMLDALGITGPIERDLYTASLSYRQHVIVTGPVADEYMRHAPDVTAIGKDLRAGKEVTNATLSNKQPSLTIRTK